MCQTGRDMLTKKKPGSIILLNGLYDVFTLGTLQLSDFIEINLKSMLPFPSYSQFYTTFLVYNKKS